VVRPLAGGRAELRFTAPRDARPGTRVLVSVTEAHTGVTVFAEVEIE
jgi:hypothetical protein